MKKKKNEREREWNRREQERTGARGLITSRFFLFFLSSKSYYQRTEKEKTEVRHHKKSRFHEHSWFIEGVRNNYVFFMFLHHILASYSKYWSSTVEICVQESKPSGPCLYGFVWYVHLDICAALR